MNLTELRKNYDRYLTLNYDAQNTIEAYRNCFEKFIFENNRVYRMSKIDLENYFMEYTKRYSNSYYNQMLSSVNIIYKLLGQPFKLKGISYKRVIEKPIDILSKNELIETFKSIKNLKHKVIISVLYLGGLRVSELLNMELRNIDFENKRILIKSSKNNISGYFPINDKFVKTLSEYIEQYSPSKYLVEGRSGVKYSATSVRNIVKNKIKSGKRLYPHLLRHTCLTNLVDEGHNTVKVQVFARHKTPKSTQRYYHISNTALQGMTLSLKP